MPRLLGLCAGDPHSRRTFSGSARQLFRALDARGALAGPVDVDPAPSIGASSYWWHLARARRVSTARLLAHWSDAAIAARSRKARAWLRSATGVSGALLYGTSYFPANEGERAPVAVGAALDATFAQLARSGESGFGWLSPRAAAACIERQRRILARCDWLFPRTRWCFESLVNEYGIDAARCVVTGAGPNFDGPIEPRSGYDGRTLLFVGRDWIRKNGPLVLSGFAIARRERPELRLVVAGPAEEDPRMPGVDWRGPYDGARAEELRALFAGASLFLCPSRFEPFGIVVVEAMSHGCPVIALDRGAATEIVADGATGTLLKEAEPKDLAEAILRWVRDPAALERAGIAARERARERFTWDHAASAILAAFEGARAGGGVPLEGGETTVELRPAAPRITNESTSPRATAREAAAPPRRA